MGQVWNLTDAPGAFSVIMVLTLPEAVTAVIKTRFPTVPEKVHDSEKSGELSVPATVWPDVIAPPARAAPDARMETRKTERLTSIRWRMRGLPVEQA